MKLFSAISAMLGKLYQRRILLGAIALFVVAVLTGYHVLFTENGVLDYRHKKAEYNNLQQEIQRLQQENDALQKSNDALQNDPRAIEQAAREKLRYAKPGEMIYVMPEPRVQPQPPAQAKK